MGTPDPSAAALIRRHRAYWPPESFLALLPAPMLAALTDGRRVMRYAMGQPLVTEGESGTDVLLLIDALAKVTARLPKGTALLAVRVGGDVIGEIALSDGGVRSATVTSAQDHTTALLVPGDDFTAFLAEHSRAGLILNRVLAHRLRAANQRRVDFTAYRGRARVARVLLDLAELHGRDQSHGKPGRVLRVRVTQGELASLAGVERGTVEREIRELRETHVIDWGYRGVTVHDMARLRARATVSDLGRPD